MILEIYNITDHEKTWKITKALYSLQCTHLNKWVNCMV